MAAVADAEQQALAAAEHWRKTEAVASESQVLGDDAERVAKDALARADAAAARAATEASVSDAEHRADRAVNRAEGVEKNGGDGLSPTKVIQREQDARAAPSRRARAREPDQDARRGREAAELAIIRATVPRAARRDREWRSVSWTAPALELLRHV